MRNGREVDGRTYDEYPERLLVDVPDKDQRVEVVARVGRDILGLRGLVAIGV